jgi:hypothetical protein
MGRATKNLQSPTSLPDLVSVSLDSHSGLYGTLSRYQKEARRDEAHPVVSRNSYGCAGGPKVNRQSLERAVPMCTSFWGEVYASNERVGYHRDGGEHARRYRIFKSGSQRDELTHGNRVIAECANGMIPDRTMTQIGMSEQSLARRMVSRSRIKILLTRCARRNNVSVYKYPHIERGHTMPAFACSSAVDAHRAQGQPAAALALVACAGRHLRGAAQTRHCM